jgi:cytochrome c oxidase assembly protein subunit 11
MSPPSLPEPRPAGSGKPRHGRLVLMLVGLVVVMTGAGFAAVPLYKAFCQVTGFYGTARRVTAASDKVLDRELEINFDTNVAAGMPWTFKAEQRKQRVKIGATSIAFFKVTNNSNQPITGRAAYNVSPNQSGAYVRKLQCFCFSEQTLAPHQTIEFPVVYFIDPDYATDPETKGWGDLTLSYTFVEIAPKPAAPATEKIAAPKRGGGLGGAPARGL